MALLRGGEGGDREIGRERDIHIHAHASMYASMSISLHACARMHVTA
jgi:hypothetical protein